MPEPEEIMALQLRRAILALFRMGWSRAQLEDEVDAAHMDFVKDEA